MNKITLLDCTLRDGGYINDWMFGRKGIQDMVQLIGLSKVDYIEIGFIKDAAYNPEQAQFNRMEQITELLYPAPRKLSAIVELGYGYPVTSFPECSEKTIDLVRVIMWKRMLKEGFEYCKELLRRGYKVCVQATRTEQYTEEEFMDLIERFNELRLRGIYIVDTFGLLDKDALLRYVRIADIHLGEGIALGYHAHNNMQQAFTNAVAVTELALNHELMIDVSVLGMGRGAGNLNSELYMHYLNEKYGKKYAIEPLLQVADDYLMPIYDKSPWGYSLPYYLSAVHSVNPAYVNYFKGKNLSNQQIAAIFMKMKEYGTNIIYDTNEADRIIKSYIS
jgi:4-hydroxy 2-oxovalerate aldolase